MPVVNSTVLLQRPEGTAMKRFLIAIACLLWQPAAALSQDIVLATDPFDEHVLDRSKVSTEIVMGVMLTGPGGDGKSPILGMELPQAWVPSGGAPTMICVRVTSKNGRYTSTNAYRIMPHAETGRRPIDFPSAALDFLEQNEAAVRITRGDCHERPAEFAPALWSAEGPGESLHVFLNAGGQRASVASDGPDGYAAQCVDETEEIGLKYSARCEFPAAKLKPGGSTTLYFTVNRNRTAEHFQIDVVTPKP
ncbi:hypothetical protein [Sinorhizobium fredii]|uniref:hypothetical protein n=1 Tax=Rhizobium fredii TaxID=380 RepID=UPI003515BD83